MRGSPGTLPVSRSSTRGCVAPEMAMVQPSQLAPTIQNRYAFSSGPCDTSSERFGVRGLRSATGASGLSGSVVSGLASSSPCVEPGTTLVYWATALPPVPPAAADCQSLTLCANRI